MKKNFISLIALGAVGAFTLSGCIVNEQGSDNNGGNGSEQSLTIACGAIEDLCQKWTETFTAQTGIKTSYVRLSSGETVARLDSAKDNPEFDVWHGGPVDGYGAAVEKGLIEAYDSPTAKEIPDKYKDPNHNWTGVYVAFWASARTRRSWTKRAWPFPNRGATSSSLSSRGRSRPHTPRPRVLLSRHCGPRLFLAVAKMPASTT